MHNSLYWIIGGLILLLLELAIPGVVIMFFGIGAILTGILLLQFQISIVFQVLIFISFSLLMLVLMRKYIVKRFNKKDRSIETEDIIGAEAKVISKISPNEQGKVEFRGSFWKAESDSEIEVGAKVKIIGKKSIVLIVQQI